MEFNEPFASMARTAAHIQKSWIYRLLESYHPELQQKLIISLSLERWSVEKRGENWMSSVSSPMTTARRRRRWRTAAVLNYEKSMPWYKWMVFWKMYVVDKDLPWMYLEAWGALTTPSVAIMMLFADETAEARGPWLHHYFNFFMYL